MFFLFFFFFFSYMSSKNTLYVQSLYKTNKIKWTLFYSSHEGFLWSCKIKFYTLETRVSPTFFTSAPRKTE